MNKTLLYILLFLLYAASTAYVFYIGRYETIYGVGVITAIGIQIIALLIFGLHLLITKLNLRKSLVNTAVIITILQFIIIVGHRVDQYRPTYVIQVPEDYVGWVYLFVTNEKRADVKVNQNGIGYTGHKGKASWKIKRGKKDISDAFSTSQQNQITIRENGNTVMTAYNVSCLDINASDSYAPRFSDYKVFPCMDSAAFLQLVEQGVVDESKLRKQVWTGNGNEKSWKLDGERSRLD